MNKVNNFKFDIDVFMNNYYNINEVIDISNKTHAPCVISQDKFAKQFRITLFHNKTELKYLLFLNNLLDSTNLFNINGDDDEEEEKKKKRMNSFDNMVMLETPVTIHGTKFILLHEHNPIYKIRDFYGVEVRGAVLLVKDSDKQYLNNQQPITNNKKKRKKENDKEQEEQVDEDEEQVYEDEEQFDEDEEQVDEDEEQFDEEEEEETSKQKQKKSIQKKRPRTTIYKNKRKVK